MKAGQVVRDRISQEVGVVIRSQGKGVLVRFPGQSGWPFPVERVVAKATLEKAAGAAEDFEEAPF